MLGGKYVYGAVINGSLYGGTGYLLGNMPFVRIAEMKKKDWDKTKRLWFKENPPNHQGYWNCALCGRWITNPDLDHIKTVGGHQELATNLDNLRPVCRECHIRRHS